MLMKMRTLVMVLLALVAVSAYPTKPGRIVGGTLTTIDRHPDMAVLLMDLWEIGLLWQACGGIILNNRSILTAAHCFMDVPGANQWRTRLGSSYASRGGQVFNTAMIINHPRFHTSTLDNDIAILRVQGTIVTSNVIQYGAIAGPEYHVSDNERVWAAGWGYTHSFGPASEQLRHVQIYTINQDICRQRFLSIRMRITDNMLCSGVLDVGGRDQCFGDSGGPLYHNGVVVGVCSFGPEDLCADPRWPGVNARVQRYASWLVLNR